MSHFVNQIEKLRHLGRHLLHDCLEILCEIEIALNNNYVEITNHVTHHVVPIEYRHLSRSDRSSWTYILLRDTLKYVKSVQHQIRYYMQ